MLNDLIKEFPIDPTLCYLNHAAVAPWPKRCTLAIQQFAEENNIAGAANYPVWESKEHTLRDLLRKLINAPSTDDIALVKNTSEGLSMVAYGIDWQEGDEIIISDEEFPSNRIVWESLVHKGVKLVEVKLEGNDIETDIAKHFSKNTRMLAISSVQYASGIKLDMEKLGTACKKNNILFCIDAIQSLGAYPLNVATNHADFVIADGHKWLMAPEGLALFYSKQAIRSTMKVNEYGWHMVKDAGNYKTKLWEVSDTAKKFECGSPNMMAAHGLLASLSLIDELGMEFIEQHLNHISTYLRQQLLTIPNLSLNQSPYEQYQSAIINFSIEGFDPDQLKNQLMERKVICASRGLGVRFSPHYYTQEKVIDTAIQRLKDLLK